jgi:hypothetical protein
MKKLFFVFGALILLNGCQTTTQSEAPMLSGEETVSIVERMQLIDPDGSRVANCKKEIVKKKNKSEEEALKDCSCMMATWAAFTTEEEAELIGMVINEKDNKEPSRADAVRFIDIGNRLTPHVKSTCGDVF